MDLTDSWARSLRAAGRAQRTIDAYLEDVDYLTIHRAGIEPPGDGTRHQLAATLRREDPIEDITTPEIEEFLVWMRDVRGLSDATVARRYRSLRQFFSWMAQEGEVEIDPMARMKQPKVVDRPPPIIPESEMEALLESCRVNMKGRAAKLTEFESRRDTALVMTLRWSGVRAAEIMGLSVESVHLDAQTFTVTGKGNRTRTIALVPVVLEAMDRYLRVRRHHPYTHLPHFWIGRNGRLTTHGLRQMLDRRCAEAGISPAINPHRFRHTFAHEAKMRGMSDESLMQVAGWQSPQMLHRYGRSASQERAQAEHQRLFGG